jgi:hypothetical protein
VVDFKKDAWLYALIAAVLALISIFTPWGSYEATMFGETVTVYMWLGGFVGIFESAIPAAGIEEGWFGSGLSLYTFAFIIASITLLLYFSLRSFRGAKFGWDWLAYLLTGVVMLVFTIFTLIFEPVPYRASPIEASFIGFAPIGIIIASLLAIIAFIFDRFDFL